MKLLLPTCLALAALAACSQGSYVPLPPAPDGGQHVTPSDAGVSEGGGVAADAGADGASDSGAVDSAATDSGAVDSGASDSAMDASKDASKDAGDAGDAAASD